jgi:hypothetical protein
MAETRKGTKFIRVAGYSKADGTRVRAHDRSTPVTSHGAARKTRRRKSR